MNLLDTSASNSQSNLSRTEDSSAESRRTPLSEKAQSARLALQKSTHLWLYLPAYISLLVALGAACRALAHFITNNDVTVYLWATLILNSAVSIGVQCGSDKVRHWSSRIRVLFLVLLPISALLFNATVLAPLEAEAEINATVSLLVGWTALLCVLLIGMRYAKGAQRVPLSAPLVPALSLFGLLNSLSVDTIVQICFVIFVAASLYLIAYERMLHRVLKDNPSLALDAKKPLRAREYSGAPEHFKTMSSSALSRANTGIAAVGYLVACSIWFAIFMGGAALFYYPIEAVIPRVMGVPLNAVHTASAALLDWRGSASTMELRGGNYPLSDREVMEIEFAPTAKGAAVTPDLWRGRIYENYSDSRWSIDAGSELKAITMRLKRGIMTPLAQVRRQTLAAAPNGSSQNSEPLISPALVRKIPFEAIIEPERSSTTAVYFPGELTAIQGVTQLQEFANGTYNALSSYRAMPYALRADLKRERISVLRVAPGLSPVQLKFWRSSPDKALNLRIDADLKERLAPIIAQIKKSALSTPRGRFDTPTSKADAIRDYLVRNCTYSLSSPLVPADQDAVVFFVTRSKSGACDLFASAMAMLLRSADVPARLATGYIQPEESEDATSETQQAPTPTNAGNERRFIVRERDAHAWVEYYVPGAGWINYDPTQGTRTTDLPIEAQIAGIFNLPDLHLDFKTLWLPALGLALIAAGLGWSFFDFRSALKTAALTKDETARARIVEVYERAVSLLSRHVPRGRHQTPLEYENAVSRAKIAEPAKQEFAALTYLLMAARYRKESPMLSKQELQACLARLRQAL